MFIADLHIHSHYSRATSRDCDLEHLDLWARRKGLDLIGTGDLTHPAWRAEMAQKLVPAEEGLYTLRPGCALPGAGGAGTPRFVLSGEISSIYKKDGRVRKVHNVVLLPTLAAAEALSRRLEAIGNLRSDGRPILGLDSRDLLEITLETCAEALFIPAHIWTPHFSLFGAYSGFDTIEACFGDLTGHIYALETGLSSDPTMNWRLSALDRYAMVSNSDAHSPPNLAREANLFDTALSYPAMAQALRDRGGKAFRGTLEFFPEEGKYHADGHRACGVCLTPGETKAAGGVCPVCGGRITVGVLHRVEALADRPQGYRPPEGRRFEHLVPLREVVAAAMGMTVASKRVQARYEGLLDSLGPELYILREAELAAVERQGGVLVAEGIRRLREGRVDVRAGYDGKYGVISLFTKEERDALSGQTSLFGVAWPEAAKAERPALSATPPTPAPTAAKAPADELNPEQWAAVTAPDPVLAVIAGPGTGKTKTLVSRIVHLARDRGVPPEDITAVTFTNKAAGELRARLEAQLGRGLVRRMHIGTFHGICLARLRAAGEAARTILPEPDALSLLGEALPDAGCSLGPREALAAISRIKNGAATQADAGLPQGVYEAYDAALAQYGAMDYDDILLRALALAHAQPAAADAHLLVDEFQDSNPLQLQLIQAWARRCAGLFVIGDPNQAIYGFRGADAHCFDTFFARYPSARRIALTRNYRSTPGILGAAQALIHAGGLGGGEASPPLLAEKTRGAPVRLVTAEGPAAEAAFVAQEIGRVVGGMDMLDAHRGQGASPAQGRSFSDIALLYRTNRQAAALEQALARESIPYIVAGREPFLREAPVRRALAFFRLLLNPADLLSLRICLGESGYPAAQVKAILAAYRGGEGGLDALIALLAQDGYASASGEIIPLAEQLTTYAPRVSREKPHRLVEDWTRDNALGALPSMELLRNIAVTEPRMDRFVQNVSLGKDQDVTRSGGRRYRLDAVSLLSLHAAKGLEFPVVFVCGVSDGLLPYRRRDGSQGNVAEERRLLYVGMTRAQDALTLLTSPTPSAFVDDIPAALAPRELAFPERAAPAGVQASLFDP